MAVVLGLIPFTLVAGFAEGFVSPSGASWPVVLTVGFGLGVAFWALVLWRGVLTARRPRKTPPLEAALGRATPVLVPSLAGTR